MAPPVQLPSLHSRWTPEVCSSQVSQVKGFIQENIQSRTKTRGRQS